MWCTKNIFFLVFLCTWKFTYLCKRNYLIKHNMFHMKKDDISKRKKIYIEAFSNHKEYLWILGRFFLHCCTILKLRSDSQHIFFAICMKVLVKLQGIPQQILLAGRQNELLMLAKSFIVIWYSWVMYSFNLFIA